MSKKARKVRTEKYFTVKNVFPPSDNLGLDILRLMAAYNDIGRLIDCMRAEPKNQTDQQAKRISSAKMSMYIRMIIGLLHEAVQVVKQMKSLPDFDTFRDSLNEEGKDALEKIENEQGNFHASILTLLERVRNKATFHYVRAEFGEAIKEFKAKRGDDVQSSFIFEDNPPKMRGYYLLADHLRDAAGFGILTADDVQKVIEGVTRLQGQIFIFLDSGIETFTTSRGLVGEFRDQPTDG